MARRYVLPAVFVFAVLALVLVTDAQGAVTATPSTPLSVPYGAVLTTTFVNDTGGPITVKDNGTAGWAAGPNCGARFLVKRGTYGWTCGSTAVYTGPARHQQEFTTTAGSTPFAAVTYTLSTAIPEPRVFTTWTEDCPGRPWMPKSGSC